MKRQLSLIGASALMALSANAFAQTSDVKLYGLVDLAYESANTGRETVQRVVSGNIFSSRWGITSTEDLGGGLKAVFKLESGFDADTGTAAGGRAFSRRSTVGIESATLGRVEMGRMPTQINEATSAFWMGGTALGLLRSVRGPFLPTTTGSNTPCQSWATQKCPPIMTSERA